MATHLKEQLAQFHTSPLSLAKSEQRVKNVECVTYPLLTCMISSFEVQDELLPHRLVSKRTEEKRGMDKTERQKKEKIEKI